MIFLDFEASGVSNGFPIEVGFCEIDAAGEMRAAGRLIRHDQWLIDWDRWNHESEAIHHISREMLARDGETPAAVMAWLNAELGGQVVFADSHMDREWLDTLAGAAGIEPTFRLLDDIGRAFAGPEIFIEADDLEVDLVCRKTHRAAIDAEHLAVKYLLSLRVGAAVHRLVITDAGIERVPHI